MTSLDSSGQSINYLLIGVAAVTVQDMYLYYSVYHTDIVYLFLNNIGMHVRLSHC